MRKRKSTDRDIAAALRDAGPPPVSDDLSGDEEEEEQDDEDDEYGRAWSELASPHPSAQFGDVRDDEDGDSDDEDDGSTSGDGRGDDSNEYEVHRVVGARRLDDGSWEWRVRWKGWGEVCAGRGRMA